jgi:hypothetical protein
MAFCVRLKTAKKQNSEKSRKNSLNYDNLPSATVPELDGGKI